MIPSSEYLNALARPEDYVVRSCLNPKRLWVYSSVESRQVLDYIPCGHCVRCRDEHRDDWTARMLLHSLDYVGTGKNGHCYFVTLTYGSYDLSLFEKHPFKADWLDTYPVLDSCNFSHRPRWTPSILVRSHLQKFIKRLRKIVDDPELSYCACGEYGSKAYDPDSGEYSGYGRPHFHLIVWSAKPILNIEFEQAWSYLCLPDKNNPFVVRCPRIVKDSDLDRVTRFYIGEVFVVDLVAKGAMVFDGPKLDGFNSGSCFSYVAKYVGKSYDYSRGESSDFTRPEVGRMLRVYRDTFGYGINNDGTPFVPAAPALGFNPDTLPYSFTYNNRVYENLSFTQFVSLLAPFFVCSKAKAIGKAYLLENLDRIIGGNFALPRFFGESIPFPSYYKRIISEENFPVRFRKTKTLGVSLCRGSFSSLLEFYCSFIKYSIYSADDLVDLSVFESFQRLSVDIKSGVLPSCPNLDPRNRSFGSMFDVTLLSSLGRVHYVYDSICNSFVGYRFDRHHRQYVEEVRYSGLDFATLIAGYLNSVIKHFELTRPDVSRSMKVQIYDTLCSFDYDRVRESYLRNREDLSKAYHSKRSFLNKTDLQ